MMSLLTRTGTLVRSKARRQSMAEVRRKRKESLIGAGRRPSDHMSRSTSRSVSSSFDSPSVGSTLSQSLTDRHEQTALFHYNQRTSSDVNRYGTFRQITDFRDESSGPIEFLKRTVDLLFCTVLAKVLLLLVSALPVSMIIVGSTYKTDCPIEPKLPLYLLVGGGFGLLKIVFLFWRQQKLQDYERLEEKSDFDDENEDIVLSRFVKFTNIILSVFLSVWFVIGNYWFYCTWEPNFEQPLHEPNDWCHRVLYKYFFYSLITTYVLLFLVLVVVCAILSFYFGRYCTRGCSGVV